MDQKRDRRKFTDHFVVLAETFDKTVSDTLMEAYFRALADLPVDQVVSAMDRALANCRYFPKPVEIRALIEGDPDDKAQRAWTLFIEAAEKVGAYNSIKVGDPALCFAIKQTFGSWPEACRATSVRERYRKRMVEINGQMVDQGEWEAGQVLSDEMLTARRKEFLANYRLGARKSFAFDTDGKYSYLPGLCEAHNRQSLIAAGAGERLKGWKQPVGVIANGTVFIVELPVDPLSGRVLAQGMAMSELPARPALRSSLALPEPASDPAGEPLDPNAGLEIVRALNSRMRFPGGTEKQEPANGDDTWVPMTDEQIEERKRQLQAQLRLIQPAIPEDRDCEPEQVNRRS